MIWSSLSCPWFFGYPLYKVEITGDKGNVTKFLDAAQIMFDMIWASSCVRLLRLRNVGGMGLYTAATLPLDGRNVQTVVDGAGMFDRAMQRDNMRVTHSRGSP